MLTFNTTDEESWAIEILNDTLEFTYDQVAIAPLLWEDNIKLVSC